MKKIFTPQQKAEVALVALTGQKTSAQIASIQECCGDGGDFFSIHPHYGTLSQ